MVVAAVACPVQANCPGIMVGTGTQVLFLGSHCLSSGQCESTLHPANYNDLCFPHIRKKKNLGSTCSFVTFHARFDVVTMEVDELSFLRLMADSKFLNHIKKHCKLVQEKSHLIQMTGTSERDAFLAG